MPTSPGTARAATCGNPADRRYSVYPIRYDEFGARDIAAHVRGWRDPSGGRFRGHGARNGGRSSRGRAARSGAAAARAEAERRRDDHRQRDGRRRPDGRCGRRHLRLRRAQRGPGRSRAGPAAVRRAAASRAPHGGLKRGSWTIAPPPPPPPPLCGDVGAGSPAVRSAWSVRGTDVVERLRRRRSFRLRRSRARRGLAWPDRCPTGYAGGCRGPDAFWPLPSSRPNARRTMSPIESSAVAVVRCGRGHGRDPQARSRRRHQPMNRPDATRHADAATRTREATRSPPLTTPSEHGLTGVPIVAQSVGTFASGRNCPRTGTRHRRSAHGR